MEPFFIGHRQPVSCHFLTMLLDSLKPKWTQRGIFQRISGNGSKSTPFLFAINTRQSDADSGHTRKEILNIHYVFPSYKDCKYFAWISMFLLHRIVHPFAADIVCIV